MIVFITRKLIEGKPALTYVWNTKSKQFGEHIDPRVCRISTRAALWPQNCGDQHLREGNVIMVRMRVARRPSSAHLALVEKCCWGQRTIAEMMELRNIELGEMRHRLTYMVFT